MRAARSGPLGRSAAGFFNRLLGYGNVPLFKHHAFTLARAPLFCGSALARACRCPQPRVSAPETRPVFRVTRVSRAVVLAVDVDGGLLTTPPPLVSPAGVAVDAQ